ncbi:uncharacterized protein LOC142224892 [Haematobia irritans]|uniref:uncharacterized protein LOC142224892 n=1 Tax=Haematobia irritans TaxID=7368 RepID=UPI003F4FF1BF
MISPAEKKRLKTDVATAPRIYGLPKTHKDGYPLRPICSCIDSPSSNLCKHIGNLLKILTHDSKYNVSLIETHRNELTSSWEQIKIAYDKCLHDIEIEAQGKDPEDAIEKEEGDEDVASEEDITRYENKRVLVNIQLKTLFSLPVITSESGSALKKLQRDINTCISLLQLYEVRTDTWDPIFTFICSNRLPDSTLTLWEQTLSDKTVIPKWSELDAFLTNRHRTLESISELRKQESSGSISKSKGSENKMGNRATIPKIRSYHNKVSDPKCSLCPNEFHLIKRCPKFLQMDPNDRFAEIKNNHLCVNCFSKSHTAQNCPSKYSCRSCSQKHNTLLHRQTQPNYPKVSPSQPSTSTALQSTTSSGNGVVHSCFATQSRGVLLGTAIVKILHNGLNYDARALVDSGSQGTFISQKLFNALKLPFRRTNAQISGLNNTISADVQKECSFVLGSHIDEDIAITTSALVVPHLAGSLPSRTVDLNTIPKLPEIPLADPKFHESSRIDMLIGGDLIPSIMLTGIKRQFCGSLIAQQTVFGWILTGPLPYQSETTPPTIVTYFCEISLDKKIPRFWEVEDIPRKRFLSATDSFCEDLYIRTTHRNEEGRYVVSLPFKESYPQDTNIGKSRHIAMAQYFRNEARLIRNPDLKMDYDSALEEYISLNHMAPINFSPEIESPESYYLPHHAVIRPESKTTRVRVVFNASAPTSNGINLNDILYSGPGLQNELIVLILKWRFFEYVFNGDITKMYRQILVNPKQTSFQRILFRKQPNHPIQDFELQTVTFGVNCAPYLAIRTMMQLADDVIVKFPLASEILKNFMYVDDALAGAHTISDAKEARNQLILALKSAGFTMRKWTSNSKLILCDLPPEDLLHDDFLEFEDSSTAKTLGIRWNALSHSFFFSVQEFPTSAYTKRETKVAPIKTQSIPRLELCGAMLLAETIEHIIPQLKLESYSVYCWTDSTIVLSWLSKPPCFWTAFVANRVSKITEIIPPCKWHHVESEMNPADLASRGLSPQDLCDNQLWWHGQPFLRSATQIWPKFEAVDNIDVERKPVIVNFTYFNKFEDILERFSSLPRAFRVIAPISSSSSLLSFNPFMDSEGKIRICGRLTASPSLSYNERHPVILPYNCQYSRLLVRFIHEISLHGGNQLVLRLIRVQYWIPKVRNLIKSTINKCKPCIFYKRRCQTQIMSALPPSRFISRRGCPLHVYSDNGTNFVGASKKIAKEFVLTSQKGITANYAYQNLIWHFIPPGAPHMGRLWEAGVKSFKSHFKKVASNFKHTFEEFQTVLTRIEACLNSRPLSPISEDPSDLSALTPGHFLICSPI